MKETTLFALLIGAVLVLLSEMVSCQWHADNLTHGCASNPVACIQQERATPPPAK